MGISIIMLLKLSGLHPLPPLLSPQPSLFFFHTDNCNTTDDVPLTTTSLNGGYVNTVSDNRTEKNSGK